jgi:hypothetical protein
MGWFDDFTARITESKEAQTISDYLRGRAVEELVKVAAPPKANLTEAQIAMGQTGEPQPSQAIAVPAALQTDTAKIVMIGLAGLAGLYLITRR